MSSLVEVNIPRCYKPSHFKEVNTVELHHFADASTEGYGVASYLRLIDVESNVHCTLVMGKSRVAPLKTVTIPRLELTAATLAVKVDRQIQQELQLPIQSVTYWTDSAIVIRYIRNKSKRFQTFEANRLQVIHDASSPYQWRHVPTENNPADLASRGIKGDVTTSATQKELEKWLNGPEFLWKEERDWPSLPVGMLEDEDDVPDVNVSPALVCAHTDVTNKEKSPLYEVLRRYSSLHRLCKTIAWLLRFRLFLRARCGRIEQKEVSTNPLTVKEIEEAELTVVRLTQEDSFGGKRSLGAQHGVKYESGRFQSLSPYEQNGILRVGGRLDNAPVKDVSKHQAILPSKHHVTTLIVRHYHMQNGHVGSNQTLAAIRQRYWIVKGPSTVRRILRTCVTCRRQNTQAPTQIMAPLPSSRVTPYLSPFSSVGIDYFGPLNVKYRRGTVKRYGCLFTCMATRAVHIEVSFDLTTDSFIQAICRFVSRRGAPRQVYSDNGSNFRGAESEIKDALCNWNQERIRGRLREKGIQWHFNAPAASHTGGVWERMIRTTRRILRSIVGSRLLDDETLATSLCEVEKVINDRPLTPLSNDPKDLEVLTPSTLLLLRQNSSVALCEADGKMAFVAGSRRYVLGTLGLRVSTHFARKTEMATSPKEYGSRRSSSDQR